MVKIIGYKYREYVSKKTNETVKGYEVYTVNELSDSKNNPCAGYGWFTRQDSPTRPLWLSVSKFNELFDITDGSPIMADVEIFFNQFGSVIGFKAVE